VQGELRRKDRQMDDADTWRLLETTEVGRLGLVDPQGWPYVLPLSFVVDDHRIYFHKTTAPGHMRVAVDANPQVCFEVDRPGPVFPSGVRGPCDTSVAYESAIAFGRCELVADRAEKLRILGLLMAKYADPSWERPDTWPLLDQTAVFAVTVERVTGKRRPLTVADPWRHQFPAAD